MSEELDSSTAAAWRTFQARLADYLVEMGDDDLLLLEAESGDEREGAAPYVQFCGWGIGQLRCEAVSNHYLAQPHQMDGGAQGQLVELGFQPPAWCGNDTSNSENFWLDAETSEADRLAVIAVRALRDVYGVTHPAFLTGHPLNDEDGPIEVATVPTADAAIAVYPSEGFDQLQQLVDDALTPWLGHPTVHDEDGDIPIDCGAVVVFVRVLPDRPVVRLFACVASDIGDLARAAAEVGLLNRDRLHFKFLLLGDAIVVHADLLAWPFAGAQLRDLAAQLCSSVGQIRDDLAVRLRDSDQDEIAERADQHVLHPALRTLLELDAEEPGSVDARLAASICDHDRDLVLELLTWNEQQEIAWRRSRDEALDDRDDDVADACAGEVEQAERATALLRAALRVIVERQAGRYERDRARRPRRPLPQRHGRRVPDPTFDEVDPEMWNR
jgi:hypothetical protein